MGKAPVWSETIVLVGWKDTNALFVFCWRMGGWIGPSIYLVGRVFWYFWQRWPRAVLTEGGSCFVMIFMVRPGQVDKNPAFIALIHVVTTGLKKIRWYQIERFYLLSSVEIWTLLADCWKFCGGSLWEWAGPMGRRDKFFIGKNCQWGRGSHFVSRLLLFICRM